MIARLDELFETAKAVQQRAYVPYSKFRVGAAILTTGGNVFSGCNVENAAYPVGACAEVGAISAMIAGGEQRIAQIMVIGDGDDLCTPCGGCRQRIREFATTDTLIHVADARGVRRTFGMEDLLPASFGPHNLGL